MSWIDVAIASLVVASALRGWTQGFVRQLGGLLGRFAGLAGGIYLAATISPRVTVVAWRPLDMVLIVAASTVAGGLIVRYFGGVFSQRIHEGRLALADSVLGASVGAAGTLVTCWLLAALLALAPWGSVGQSIGHSAILRYVQRVLPTPPSVVSRLQIVLGPVNVPGLFADVVGPRLLLPSYGALSTTHHVTSPAGVVAVEAYDGCGLVNQATGFVVAPDEVVTTAHVVAGQRTINVAGLDGQVVYFDSYSDLAVIHVANLSLPALPLGTAVARGTPGTVVGYASFTDRASTRAIAAGTLTARSRNIYSGPVFTRSLDVVVAPVTMGEAGAPVLMHGAVSSMVIEPSVATPDVAFAVSVAQVRAALAHVSTHSVSTQRCVN